MLKNLYDCIIIGAGPGGLQAAIHLARYNRKVLLLDKGEGRTRHALRLENYLGLNRLLKKSPVDVRQGGKRRKSAVYTQVHEHFEPLSNTAWRRPRIFQQPVKTSSGKKLIDMGISQIKSFGAEFKAEEVKSLQATENIFAVSTNRANYQAPYLVVSSGARENLPLIKGMNKFFARTIFTCVDCDGYHSTNKKLVILGDSLEAFRLAFAMRQMFTSDISLILPADYLPADHLDLLREDGINFVAGKPEEFYGKTKLAGIRLADGQEVPCEVVMLSYDYILNDSFLAGLPLKREKGSNKLTTDHNCETSIKNLFALGALKTGKTQAIIAAGQGATVGMEINHRLLEL